MQNQFVSRDDAQDGARPTTEFVAEGLFSHPDTDHPSTRPGPPPAEEQRSYTGLFHEPADGPANAESVA
ncbi:hypothetical protein FXN61_44225 [Lentzea sp. PSKA42]|uniref:Uncharacterized protein n=1 Tax=Lentzea indica TaxID=2604800 RepID=A0ABX1FY30_9PSEU|nr:hypothetical protein [Lentzea indica]NKE63361.1 hypothetical protein [Lentzea indica]